MNTKLENVKQPKLTQPSTAVDKKAMNLAVGWYIAMESKALGKKPIAIELFGQLLVAWRDQKNHPIIMDRQCAHMGASLAIGEVVDGCIQCPFHHWRFDQSGQCVSAPDVDYIPSRARLATYVTVERYGYIWVWYGSNTPLFPLPEFPAAEAHRHNYMVLRFSDPTATTVRQLLENTFDYYHFTTLHHLKVSGGTKLTLLNDQHLEQQDEPSIPKEACFRSLIEYSVESYGYLGKLLGPVAQGLGINGETTVTLVDSWPTVQRLAIFIDGKEMYNYLVGTTPVAENNTFQVYLVMVKKTGNLLLDMLYYVLLHVQNKIALSQDIPVYNTIKPEVGRAYVKQDQGVLKFREFYQRWVDKVEY